MPVRLSPSEERLMALLPLSEERRIDTKRLIAKFYRGGEEPFNARMIVLGMIRTIERKLPRMKSARRLRRTERSGPYPIEVWLEEV
jgi:hypothetical protein